MVCSSPLDPEETGGQGSGEFSNRAQRQKASSRDGGSSSCSVGARSLSSPHPGVSARSSCSACDEPCGLLLRSSTGQRRKKKKKRLLIMPDPPPRNCTQHGQSHRFSRLLTETSVVCDANEALPGGASRWFLFKAVRFVLLSVGESV